MGGVFLGHGSVEAALDLGVDHSDRGFRDVRGVGTGEVVSDHPV